MELFLVVFLCLYLAPWCVAEGRELPSKNWVLAANLLLGWTLIGWVATLAWALRSEKPGSAPGLQVLPGGRPDRAESEPSAPTAAPAAHLTLVGGDALPRAGDATRHG
ncbi:MAG: superinfection immunity protein [Myxococcota bacterium]